jgi:hypothetical protein
MSVSSETEEIILDKVNKNRPPELDGGLFYLFITGARANGYMS